MINILFIKPKSIYTFFTPPCLHEGSVRDMVGHLKFRVFPPFLPFAAIHCRQTPINNAVRKRKRHSGSDTLLVPQQNPIILSEEFILVGGWLTFVRLTLTVFDILPLSVLYIYNEMLQ